MFQFCFGTYLLVEFMTISKCARCAQCAHCTLCAPGAQTVPQVHECAHLKVVVSKQLPFAHCVHTRASSAQGYTKTFLMSTLIFLEPTPTPFRRRQPDWWRQVAYTGTKLLYQPQPQPVVYIVPIRGRTFWAAWRWPPTASTEPSPMNGTICRVLITPEECVIPRTGRAVGASSSTSILGL